MTSEKYGAPKAGDTTSQYDQLVEEMAGQFNQRAQELAEELINRPVGSKMVKKEDQLSDYLLIRDDPQKLSALYAADAAKFGKGRALERFLKYVETMEKRLK